MYSEEECEKGGGMSIYLSCTYSKIHIGRFRLVDGAYHLLRCRIDGVKGLSRDGGDELIVDKESSFDLLHIDLHGRGFLLHMIFVCSFVDSIVLCK
jgi:hypothetical protein